jgi:hypothetical protein
MHQTLSTRSTKPARVVLRTLAGTRKTSPGASPEERAAVLSVIRDGRDVSDRAMDVIVDRMLRELTW